MDRSTFCATVLGNQSPYSHLLEDSIFNLGFFYEEGTEDFRKQDTNGKLTNLGKLSLKRWKSGITAIHFLFPSRHQASNTRTAEGPHGQATFVELVKAMQEYKGPEIRFMFYSPEKIHSTEFLFVLNGESAAVYTSQINWKKVKHRIPLDHQSTIATSLTVRQAPGNYADYGFCTSQNSSRNGSTTGHAMPALKPNSKEPEIVDVFLALTCFADSTRPLWRTDHPHFAMLDSEMMIEFAQKIHARYGLPSLHLAVTSVDNPCGCHNDGSTNSKNYPDVVCISVIEDNVRLSCNVQQRKSIDNYKIRCSEFGQPLLAIEEVYRGMEVSRLSVTPALFEGKQVEYLPGFPTITNKCNMNPNSYSMPVFSCTVRLGRHFNLTLPELHSVQIAYQLLPHTLMFFGVATEMLLQLEPSQIPDTFRIGYGFGYLFGTILLDVFELTREAGGPQGFRRFSLYREPSVPDRKDWEESCHETCVYCMHVFAAFPKPSSKKTRSESYKKIVATISEIWAGVGVLTANHSINQKACLGFLPAWCRDSATVDPKSKVVEFFNKKFDLKRKLNRTELDRFLSTLSRRLEVVFDGKFTERIIENILCKAFRCLGGRITNWCDTLLPGQQLFQFKSHYVLVISPNGEIEEAEGDAIINRFPYGDELLTMEEIVSAIGFTSVMPSQKRRSNFIFYGKVWHPTVKFEVDFHVPTNTPLSKEAMETTNATLSKWIGTLPSRSRRKRKNQPQ